MDALTRPACAEYLLRICCGQARGNECGWASMRKAIPSRSLGERVASAQGTAPGGDRHPRVASSGHKISRVTRARRRVSDGTAESPTCTFPEVGPWATWRRLFAHRYHGYRLRDSKACVFVDINRRRAHSSVNFAKITNQAPKKRRKLA